MKRVAKIIIYKGEQILLHLRDDDPSIPFPNTWSLIGGEIEPGESAEEAMRREIEEEIGCKLSDIKLIKRNTQIEYSELVENNLFSAEIKGDITKLTLKEGKRIKLFNKDQLGKIDISPAHKKSIMKFVMKN